MDVTVTEFPIRKIIRQAKKRLERVENYKTLFTASDVWVCFKPCPYLLQHWSGILRSLWRLPS